jgi:DNA-directed RNA polymerase beta' subunit
MMNNRNNKDKNPVKGLIKNIDWIFSWIYLERIKRWSFEARNDQLQNTQTRAWWSFLWKNFGPVKILNVLVENTKELQRNHLWPLCVKLLKKVRRDRVGHINLVVPIAHIWYFRSSKQNWLHTWSSI